MSANVCQFSPGSTNVQTRARELGLPVVRYVAAEGALMVFYGDDNFEVPLLGWSAEAVSGYRFRDLRREFGLTCRRP